MDPPKTNRSARDLDADRYKEWIVPVDLVRQWRWRCAKEGVLVPGSALFIAIPDCGRLIPLVESGLEELSRENLRHACGAGVVPVASRETE